MPPTTTSAAPVVWARAHVELADGTTYDRVRAVFNGKELRVFDNYGTPLYRADASRQAQSSTSLTLTVDEGSVLIEKQGCGCGGRR